MKSCLISRDRQRLDIDLTPNYSRLFRQFKGYLPSVNDTDTLQYCPFTTMNRIVNGREIEARLGLDPALSPVLLLYGPSVALLTFA